MKKSSLSPFIGVMDLCWYYGWATFFTLAVLKQPFPFPEAVGAFALAGLLTHFSLGRGWRIIWVVALQAVFFIPALIMTVGVFNSWSSSYAAQTWLIDSFFTAAAAQAWFMFILVSIWIFAFWGGGVRLALGQADYETVCLHFDRGLVAFFILVLVKFLLLPQLDLQVEGFGLESLFFSFFLFSLLAIGLARHRSGTAPRDYLPGYGGLGVILGFAVVVILGSAGLIFFCLPYLTKAAEAGYGLMKEASRPAGAFLLMILRFIFGSDDWEFKERAKEAAKIAKHDAPSSHSWWWELIGQILGWVMGAILVAVILVLLGALVYFLIQWLFSFTEAGRPAKPLPLPPWLARMRFFLQTAARGILGLFRTPRGIMSLYAALQKWGRRSGLPRLKSETPAEYGLRLQSRFPALGEEIASIAETYNRQVYGGIAPEQQRLAATRLAWVRLRRPRHWPRRLKTWFLRPWESSGNHVHSRPGT